MWFFLALTATFGWGFADLFYKKGTDDDDGYSHLKIAVWVGLVMGAASLCLFPFAETDFTFKGFLFNIVRYSPASLSYIISMVIGYAGMRYLELSIISPVQNGSGALSTVVMLIYFSLTGKISSIGDEFSALDIIGTAVIVAGVIALAVVEQKLGRAQRKGFENNADKKYISGALALMFPMLYCLFDTAGTAADGIILDGSSGLGLGEIDVLILYGITFAVMGLACWLYMLIKGKKAYNPFAKTERSKGIAALCEEFGQVFYVYAMAAKPMLAAPMVASYCIVSVILSRVFLGEKLRVSQYACVFSVIAGIVILGISEGLADA